MSYKKLLDNIEWSFSSLHQYEQCPFAFYNHKIDGSEIDEGNFYSDVGNFIHEVSAKILDNSLSVDEAVEYYVNNYENNIIYSTKQSIMDKKFDDGLNYIAEFNIDKLKDYEVLGVEKEVHFKVDRYKFVGYIDLLLRRKADNKILLIDHKSQGHFTKKDGTPLKSKLDSFQAYSKQMYLYSRAIYEEYGIYPDRIIWNHFFEQQVTDIPFVESDYLEALEWAKNIIKEIYKDEEFNARYKYVTCGVICGFRNSCDYADDTKNIAVTDSIVTLDDEQE